MKRKVIKQGNNTLTITLPREWIEKNKIKAGDEIDVAENQQHNLEIGLNESNYSKTKEVSLKYTDKNYIKSVLAALYREGCTELKVKFHEDVSSLDIEKVVDELFGFEITEQARNRCTIRFVINEKDDPEKTITKIFQIILTIIDAAIASEKIDYMYYKKKISMFKDYSMRLLNSQASKENYSEMRLVSFILDQLGGSLAALFDNLNKKGVILDKESRKIMEAHKEIFNKLYDSWCKKDFDLSSETYLELRKRLIGLDYMENTPYDKLKIGRFLYYHLELMYALSSRLQGLNAK
jgi:hypothetical protein